MGKAWIDGAQAPEGEAVAAAARLLSRSRLPLITGLATDVAGVKAALALARRCGGVVDHDGSAALYRNIEVLRGSGMFVAAPAEMRRRADRFLIVGPDAEALAPDLLAFVLGGTRDLGRASEDGLGRRIVWLGAPAAHGLRANGAGIDSVACDVDGLTDALAMIRAALGGRRFGDGPIPAEKASGIAALLGKAAFACVVWSAASLDALGVEMASGLVADINIASRASSLPLSGAGQAWGAALTATAVSGFPLRVSFGRGAAEHDAWAHESGRLIGSGESDLVVHVSALGDPVRSISAAGLPLISITGADVATAGAAVTFGVGIPGRDHGGALYLEEAGSFVPVEGAGDGAGDGADDGVVVSAAHILKAIAAALGDAPFGDAAAERAA